MKHYKAKKVVIITEKVVQDKVTELIQECGAHGYTVTLAGGKGSRGVRSVERATVSESFANIKIEVITPDDDVANEIMDRVTETYFTNYSGITYLEDVEILRPAKF